MSLPQDVHACGHDAAAYVLGALEPAEAERFAQHLDSCIVCRDEILAFQQIVDVLPMAAPQHRPSRGLRRRVLRDVRSQRGPEVRPVSGRRPWTALPGLSLPRPALALAVLLLGVLATVGGLALQPGSPSGARVIQASVTGLPGSARLRLSGGHAELIVRRLPPPPAGRIYEVWLERRNRPPSPTSALFSVTANGSGDVDVPGDLRGVADVMVTQEPAGGSLVPTHAPVISVRLA